MTPPVQPQPISGQITLESLITYIESLIATLTPEAQTLLAGVGDAFRALETFFDPAAGRETQRETELAEALLNKDLTSPAGLYAFWNRLPREPNKSLAICEADIKLLGGTVPPVPVAPAAP